MNSGRKASLGKDHSGFVLGMMLPLLAVGAVVGQNIPVLNGKTEKVFTTTSEPGWLEGPVYDTAGGVWFIDMGRPFAPPTVASRVLRFSIASGASEVKIGDAGGANGLAFSRDGRLIAAHSHDLNVTSRPVDNLRDVTVLADDWQGGAFTGPNDLTVDGKGGIYFSDPSAAPPANEVYYISPTGKLQRTPTGVIFNNGVALTPDGKTLYVASTGSGTLIAFDISADGSLVNQRVFVATPALDGRNFTPDGVAIDQYGNVYVADLALEGRPETLDPALPGSKVRVWNSGGKEILRFEPPEGAIDLTFAPPDGNMLYFTSTESLWRVPIRFADVEPEPIGRATQTRIRTAAPLE